MTAEAGLTNIFFFGCLAILFFFRLFGGLRRYLRLNYLNCRRGNIDLNGPPELAHCSKRHNDSCNRYDQTKPSVPLCTSNLHESVQMVPINRAGVRANHSVVDVAITLIPVFL